MRRSQTVPPVVATPYGSFLLRCWDLGGERQHIRIEHVQSGADARLDSLEAALEWMRFMWDRPQSESANRGERNHDRTPHD